MIKSPLAQSQRIDLVDALRGFALFGILMVNIHLMYEPITQIMLGAKADASLLHVISESFVKFFFEGKFYVIFSMLFGFGFFVFMNKIADSPDTVLPLFRRRLFFLLLFGLAHITLLWAGDVLLYYALAGFLLIPFRNTSDKKIFKWAVVLILLPVLLMTFITLGFSLASNVPAVESSMNSSFQIGVDSTRDLIERVTQVYSTGSFSEIISMRVTEYLNLLSGSLFSFVPVVLGMFLIGFLAARKGILSNYNDHFSLFKRIFWWGLSIGVVTSALYAYAFQKAILMLPSASTFLTTSMHIIGGFALGMCYVSLIAILFIKGKAGFFRKYLAPVGRMALTNYLMQSIITAFLFHSYGLGLYGNVEVWQGIVLTVAIFAFQIGFSQWWLSLFQFGPFEWLWRSLTYRKMQDFKRAKIN